MTPPVLAGSYTVVATVSSRNFVGAATGTLVIAAPVPDPAPATSPTLVDNADASGISFVGTWSPSTTTPKYWDKNYHHDANNGKGSKSAMFKPTLPSPGTYEIFIRHPSRSDYAANVPVDIVHAGGTNTVTLNQRLQGGTWKSLGLHSFNAGASGYVRIRTTGTTGYVVADAVMFVATEFIVDNKNVTGVTFVGSWSSSTTTPKYWGDCYHHDENKNKGSKSVTFTPSLATAGTYQVFMRHPSRSDYPANVPVDISHGSGIATVEVNQRLDGGVWKPLGTFDFQAGTAGSVRIRTTGTSGYVAADAVKWVLVTANSTPTLAAIKASRPNHTPSVLISRDPSGHLTLEWETVAGVGYTLESATDPAATWKQLLETTGDGSLQSFQVAPEARQALFRVRITEN
jgi:predicted secreted protein